MKRKLEVGDAIEEFGLIRTKGNDIYRARTGYKKADVIAVVDEPGEFGMERVALIRYFDGDENTGWYALTDIAWQTEIWRFDPERHPNEG